MTSQQYTLRLERTELADKYQPNIEYFGKRTMFLERLGVHSTIVGMTLMAAVVIMALLQS